MALHHYSSAQELRQRKALIRLSELGLVSKNGVFYEIDDAMLTFWLKDVYQRRRQLLVDGTFDKMKLFSQEITSYISAFEEVCEMTSSARLAELLNAFSNELVSIESKNIRLPHFTKVEIRNTTDSRQLIAASFLIVSGLRISFLPNNIIFDAIAEDIAEKLDNGIPKEVVANVIGKWRNFWKKTSQEIMSSNEIMGLFGELWFLYKWLLPYLENFEAIKRWRGPFSSRHDFEWKGKSVEVKSTTNVQSRVHKIHGIDQLSPPENGDLFLIKQV